MIAVSLIAGAHGALYGSWKDAPHESFRAGRFLRELVLAGVAGGLLAAVEVETTPLVKLLSVFSLTRISTEFYKLFLRRESQMLFRIPTQVHVFGHVVESPLIRVLLGLGWITIIAMLYTLVLIGGSRLPARMLGALAGLLFGIGVALAGAYKDGWIEGFFPRKFFKSPALGVFGGLLVSFHTSRVGLLVLGSIAVERMLNELLFKVLRPGYVPGKFKVVSPRAPEWVARRRWLLAPYALTWIAVGALWAYPLMMP